jgi:hypothetical protein
MGQFNMPAKCLTTKKDLAISCKALLCCARKMSGATFMISKKPNPPDHSPLPGRLVLVIFRIMSQIDAGRSHILWRLSMLLRIKPEAGTFFHMWALAVAILIVFHAKLIALAEPGEKRTTPCRLFTDLLCALLVRLFSEAL